MDKDTGRQTVAQLEKSRRITIDIAFAYAEIFDVSVDYVLGRSDDWDAENKAVKNVLGLSDGTIRRLASMIPPGSDSLKAKLLDQFIGGGLCCTSSI